MPAQKIYQRYLELQQYIGWTPDDAERVHRLAPAAKPYFDSLIDDFYAAIRHNPATAKIITGGSQQIERLKHTLLYWLAELFSGSYDQDYVMGRWRVGIKHVEIGLDQVYASAALSRLRGKLLNYLRTVDCENAAEWTKGLLSLNKLFDLDLVIIEEAYLTEHQRRQQLSQRLATIGQVAGGIAHELRNPLSVIKTSVYFLRNANNLSAEKSADHLERIDRQASLADGVITALNNFAKLPLPEMKPIEIAPMLHQIFETAPLPESIRLKMDIPPQLPAVMGDLQQLSIVFNNLFQNAREAMPRGGTLTIAMRHLSDTVQIDVTDTGTGISKEDLPKIMEPLFTTKARGIGLGLAISRAILEKHDGELRVRSEIGQGTTFTVQLAAAPGIE